MSSHKIISNFLAKIGAEQRTGEPLALRLKNYFESKKCIDFDYNKDTLSLSFEIFTECLEEQSESGDTENIIGAELEKQIKSESKDVVISMPSKDFHEAGLVGRKTYKTWFLKLLAKEMVLQPLCHHPYITAFLDLHFSAVQKARSQMQDSVPHLALTLLLLVLVSTLPGQLNMKYENVLWLATLPCLLVLVLDTISMIGLKSQWISNSMENSLYKHFKKPRTTSFGMFTSVLINVTHIIGYSVCIISLTCGYFVSISEGEIVKENTCLLKKFLETVLMVFPMLLMVVEITLIKLAGGLRNHFKSSKNCIDLVGIVFALGMGSMSMAHDISDLPWMPNLIWIVILLIFTQLFYDIVDCLPNNDTFHVQQYMHLFIHVVKRYFVIILGFCPFLMAFAACFKGKLTLNRNKSFHLCSKWYFLGIASNESPYARNLYGAFVRTIVWFVGNVENEEWIRKEDFESLINCSKTSKQNENGIDREEINTALKTEDVLAKFILLAFIFLFMIVLMNLLNAIAVEDVQVCEVLIVTT